MTFSIWSEIADYDFLYMATLFTMFTILFEEDHNVFNEENNYKTLQTSA